MTAKDFAVGMARTAALVAVIGMSWTRTERPAAAEAPTVTVDAAGVHIRARAATVAELLESLGRAAHFDVRFDGPRPSSMLYEVSIDAPTPLQALLKILDGQSVNYGFVLDPGGTRVLSLMTFGAPPKSGPIAPASPPAANAARPQSLPTPRPPRGVPINEDVPDEPPELSTEPEPTPTPAPTPAPAPTPPGFRPGATYPPLARPPFGSPFGPRPTPSATPSP